MKLPVKSDYAARAVLGLARVFHKGRSCRVEDLAASQGVPAKYLVQILIELKSARIVRSVRGKDGGYLLARPPGEISLGDVLRCVHGQVFESPAATDADCPAELREAWIRMQREVEATANAINFQTLLDESQGKDRMYYI